MHSDKTIVLVSATDDGYAMPLAVTVRSALERLSSPWAVQLYVLDGGIAESSKQAMLRSWAGLPLTVQWLKPNMRQVSGLMVSHHVNVVTYLRLLMPLMLPKHVERALYLDADMVVLKDIAKLWCEDLGSSACLAVQDAAAPFIDSEIVLPNIDRCRPYLAAIRPIANYRELSISGTGKYFNGGLMLANIRRWREDGLATQMLNCLRDHSAHILWWDQYALNVVLSGMWRALDPRWNQGSHIYCYPNQESSPFDAATFHSLQKDAWIVHFTSPSKPWHITSDHPYREAFRDVLRRTDWRDFQLIESSARIPQQKELSWWRTKKLAYRAFRKKLSARISKAVNPNKWRKAG